MTPFDLQMARVATYMVWKGLAANALSHGLIKINSKKHVIPYGQLQKAQ